MDGGGDKTKITNPKTLTPREASDVCLSCHNRSGHTDWSGGKHDSRNMSCVTCHSVHAAKPETKQLKTAGVTEDCFVFSGPARVYESQEATVEAILRGDVRPGDVVVVRYEGPRGGPGMQEMLYPTSFLKGRSSRSRSVPPKNRY